jgi:hypothetical protein
MQLDVHDYSAIVPLRGMRRTSNRRWHQFR